MINWSWTLSNFIHSSKVNLISYSLKLVEFNFGLALTKTGGIESFGPPVGLALFAQPFIIRVDSKK